VRHSSCTSIAGNGDKVPSVILVAWGRFRDTLQKSVFEVHEDLLGSVLRSCRRGVDGHIRSAPTLSGTSSKRRTHRLLANGMTEIRMHLTRT
jgi:hypothetical protein